MNCFESDEKSIMILVFFLQVSGQSFNEFWPVYFIYVCVYMYVYMISHEAKRDIYS